MACTFPEPGRKRMAISVTILGIALLTVMMAYLSFDDSNDDQESLNTICMAGIIFRHGDRSPTELYPNDPHLNYNWPGGLGALSEKGSLQLFNLGKRLKQRYYKLIPSNGLYSKNVMYVLSSAAERCLMSASAFLAGFIPPLKNHNKLPISWQPVPINSVPRDRDYLLAQKKSCPKYDELLKQLNNNSTKEIVEINAKNSELYKYLTNYTGKNITNILDVELLYNTLEIELNAGLKLPKWTENIFPQKMLPLAERNLALLTETEFMKKVKGGALLTDILQNMLKKQNQTLQPDRSIFIYSAHDVTLVNLMRALDILNQTAAKPDYAATLILELHHSVKLLDDFEVKIVYYYNSEDKIPKELQIPNCYQPCSLKEFTASVSNVIIQDYQELCNL